MGALRDIRLFIRLSCAFALVAVTLAAGAHPAPFSYLDLYLEDRGARGMLVIHDYDAAYELGVDDPQALLAAGVARERAAELLRIVAPRLRFDVDGRRAGLQWQPVEVLPDRQSWRFGFTLTGARAGAPARIAIDTILFPYDPNHQTFVNIYESERLERQAILDAGSHRLEHYAGSVQGRFAVVRAFVASGIEHILIGPDHVLFLLGLLLLGGSLWRLASIVTAFTFGHSVTLSLAALDLVRLSPALVEPAIALSIVVVGVDNLLVRSRGPGRMHAASPAAAPLGPSFALAATRSRGAAAPAPRDAATPSPPIARDLRPWLAAVFGLIHGFGFAAVLREVGLPREALGWSLAAFNVGVEIGQLAVVGAVVALLAAVRRYDVLFAERCVLAGSVGVIAAGVYWFTQRVWFGA